MALTGIFWNRGLGGRRDLHVLRGQTSRRLDEMLMLEDSGGASVAASVRPLPADVTSVSFRPIFAFTLAAHGHVVDAATGAVTVAAALPAGTTAVPNFIIDPDVRHTSASAPIVLPPHPIRLHIHGSVTKVWLTPDPLTVRVGAADVRFSILAEFDDGTVGDISFHPGVTWASSAVAVPVDPSTGFISPTASGLVATITATLPADMGGGSASAEVRSEVSWSTALVAELVPGSPGSVKLNDVPNILFISEGFLGGEKAKFEKIAQTIAKELRAARTTLPFNLLGANMNYWSVFVPSRQRGATVLNGLRFLKRTGAKKRMEDLPHAERPDPTSPDPITKLENLIFQVGLPVPADRTVDPVAKTTDWINLYGAAHLRGLNVPILKQWRELADYTLAFEQDTALGLKTGTDRPQVEFPDNGVALSWHRFRAFRGDLNKLVRNLTSSDNGAAIGAVWDTGGKDHEMVFALVAGAQNSGAKSHPPNALITSNLVEPSDVIVKAVASSNLVRIEPYELPKKLSMEIRATVAHETGHTLRLGDERGGSLPTLVDPSVLDGKLNLHSEASVLDAGSALDADLIRWNWPRISKVGVLVGQPQDFGGGDYRFTIGSGTGGAFAIGDLVRLRIRPLTDPQLPSELFEIANLTGSAAGDDIDVKLAAGGSPITVADWPAGTLVYFPTRHPTTNVELTLMWDDVRTHLTSSGTPLNRTTHNCVADDLAPQTAVNVPAGLPAGKPKYSSWLIGLYDGGQEVDCGVFHPAGACLMRRVRVPASSRQYAGSPYRFCAVCRYIIIDILDPLLHPQVDADYATFFPV